MKTIEEQWLEFFPESPFKPLLASEFAREAYKNDQNLFSLFIYFTIISGLLSVLGLFGLTSLLIEQKTKTIGIRRVLGGSIRKITAHLIRDYMLLVLSAGIISLPVSYYLLDKQLDQFAYHISISVWHMLLSVLLLAFVAFVTIVVKAYRAARANPVDALKYE
jgi:putative ABC transport system permease protein